LLIYWFSMKQTKFHSYANGELSNGCKQCVKGQKLVLFITGVCTNDCYFCPLSEEKYHKDVIFANERPIVDFNEIIEEAKVSGARGAGITGGDPLTKIERTVEVIKLLKKTFGKFHVHLYTPLKLVDEEKIKLLEDAGLDEIRFHLDLDDNVLWERVKIKTKMVKGMEIPCVPGKDVKKAINFVKDYVDFVNLNELEYSDAKHNKLAELGFTTKNDYTYAIKGSQELALEMLEEFSDLRIHYCTVKLKDSVQLMNRIERRAKNVKNDFDIINGASLIRGAIYGEDLEEMYKKVSELFKCVIDERKKRLLCSKGNAIKYSKKLRSWGYRPEVVEELGTWDQWEIESQEV